MSDPEKKNEYQHPEASPLTRETPEQIADRILERMCNGPLLTLSPTRTRAILVEEIRALLPPTTTQVLPPTREVELRVITPEGVESGELYRLPAQRPFFVVTIPDDAPAQKGRDLADVLTLVYPELFTLILRPGSTVKAYEVLPSPSSPGG